MTNACEITVNVEGEVVRFTQMNTGEWWQMGSQSKYKSSFTARGAMLSLIWEQKQTIANLTTELETARAEMDIYRTQRDQVSAETTIDEERFQRVFWEAFREWERSVSMGFGDLTRQVLSRYLAEMTAMKPAPGIYVGTLTAEQMSNDEIIIPPSNE